MIPLIFKRKKTAEYLRQNSGEQDDRKKHGQQSSRARTLEDHYSGNTSFSGHSSCDTGEPGSNPGYARQGSSGSNSGCDGSGVAGSGGGYLATGGYNYSYDYGGGVGGGGRGVGGRGAGVRGGSPQPVRRSPSPLGSGEWALRECENHTTWLNDLRKRLGQPQITDLRTAVADGITLVQLTEALTNSEVRQTDHDRLLSKPQALVNLDRCLAHLAACGVDVIGIQANDLVEGDLKSSLLLLTQIRRRYDSVQSRRTQGDGEHAGGNGGGGGRGGQGGGGTERVTVHPNRWSPDLEMPGRIDTSPRLSRTTHTTDKVSPRMRRGQAVDEDRMIPGMMTSEEHVMSSGHQNLQHTDSERPARQFSSNYTSSAKPSPAPRTQGPMTSERPPSQLGVAWAADSASKPRQTPDSAGGSGGPAVSVEGRLRQLLIDTQKTAARPVQYNDGELLLPPPPSRGFGDGVTLGGVTANHSAGLTSSDGTRPHGQASHDQGYVPSRPSDRRSGSRTETMLRDSTNQQPDPYLRHSAPPSGGQFTNYGFVSDSQPSPPYSESQRSASSIQKADMRSAWTKLYGPTSDFRPSSGHSVTSSPYTGRRENTAHEELLPLTHKPPHSFNPSQQRRLSQPTNNHIPPHRGDSAPSPFPLHPRESPMGQSSSTQGQTSDSSYRSSHSGQTAMAGFKSNGGREEEEEDEDEGDVERELRTLGPASKYPDSSDSRPSSARMTPQTGKTFGLRNMFPTRPSMLSRTDMRNSPQTSLKDRGSPAIRDFRTSSRDVIPSPSRDFNNGNPIHSSPRGGGSVDPRTLSGARVNPAFSADTNDGREIVQSSSGVHLEGLDRVGAVDSIFDYTNSRRQLYSESSSNRSVTPPLPPLSPTSSQPDPSSPSSTNHSYNPPFGVRPHSSQGFPVPAAMLRQRSSSALGVPRTPDLLVTSSTPVGGVKRGGGVEEGRGGGGSRHGDRTAGGGGSKSQAVPAERKNHGRCPSSKYDIDPREISSRYFARSRSLDDLRESGNESNHDLSFDVETTMLTVAPSDISEMTGEGSHNHHHHHHHNHNPHSDVPPKDARAIKGQLERLETMYHDVIKMVGTEKPHGKSGRRWSIASSDTSSLRKGRHGMRGGSSSSRGSKDLRSIQRRFQRLESHVVTLARSLAHLSSELRTQNALRRDVDVVKRDLREMKQQAAAAKAEPPISLGGAPFDKFRGWIPSLTNPKRINKLTQFFGQEPPLLEIFLKKLGYERYAKNFSAEHIGMIELPYMTEDRLETIGIPLGPRLRILQESQLCFRQENFDIYIV